MLVELVILQLATLWFLVFLVLYVLATSEDFTRDVAYSVGELISVVLLLCSSECFMHGTLSVDVGLLLVAWPVLYYKNLLM